MKTVREILNNKGNEVWSISPEATVYEALKLMAEKEIGAMPVLENGNLTGIISERDYARKIALQGKSSREIKVREIMTEKVLYVKPTRTVEECMALMTNKHIRHLPVMEGNTMKGFISIGDVVKAMIEERDFLIDQLIHYITDTPAIETEQTKHNAALTTEPHIAVKGSLAK